MRNLRTKLRGSAFKFKFYPLGKKLQHRSKDHVQRTVRDQEGRFRNRWTVLNLAVRLLVLSGRREPKFRRTISRHAP